MNHNHANWDEGTTKTLLDLCIAQKNQFNWSNRCLSKLGWKNVYRSFNQQTGLHLGSKQLQNKLNALRRTFLSWTALQNQSSLGHDTQTGGVAADPTYWEDDEARSGSLEQYIRDLSESVAKRSQKCADHAQGEMNPDYRTTFTQMKTKEGRLNWIQFNWDMLNK
uniref:Myb/SANT-like domain-containing protein n=1 Tax=Setaria italica TaxID=4555 RepID=K3XQ67_SETIT